MRYLLLILLCSCVASKKVTNTVVSDTTNTQASYHVRIDTTVTKLKDIQITEITFGKDTIKSIVTIGNQSYNGNILSAEVTVISKSKTNNGITIVDSSRNTKEIKHTNTTVKSEPGASPYKWLWIAISILGILSIIVFLYYKIKPFITAFKLPEWISHLKK